MHTLKKLFLMVILSIMTMISISCDPMSENSSGIRLLTLNTQMLVNDYIPNILDPQLLEQFMHALGELPDVENEYGITNEARAEKISDAIIAMKRQPDVIALQEVFDDDAKDAFEKKLKNIYPHFVKELDAEDLDPWDSGLMLFSKFPFAPLLKADFKAKDVTAFSKSSGNFQDWEGVAYKEFRYKNHFDTFANKGVGLVRLEIKCGNSKEYMYVAFTHTQASYGDDSFNGMQKSVSARISQLEDIESIIKGTLPQVDLDNEPLFIMGDLNINGNFGSLDFKWGDSSVTDWTAVLASDEANIVNHCRLYEWDYHFNRHLGNSYFSTYISDSWVYDNIRTDYGQTIGGDFPKYFLNDSANGERLDYILHNNNKGISSAEDMTPELLKSGEKLSVQHIQRVWEPSVGSVHYYSDHLGLIVDVNKCYLQCNPRIAKEINPDPDITCQGKIKFAEGMQWFKVGEQGGAYSINTIGSVKIEVYEDNDLSRPIRESGVKSDWGMIYSVPTAPFYVKVIGENINWSGNYTLKIHKHEGKSIDDAILLDPMQYYEENSWEYGYEYTMPELGKINDTNIVWFRIAPLKGSTGGLPSIKAIVDCYHTPIILGDDKLFTIEMMDFNTSIVAKSADSIFPYSDFPNLPTSDMWRAVLEAEEISKDEYYLRVHASYPHTKGDRFTIHWQTNLTYLYPEWLRCYEQEDNSGDDDIYLWASVDEYSVQDEVYLGEFDDGGEDFGEYGTEVALNILNYQYVKDVDIILKEKAASTAAIDYNSLQTVTINPLKMNLEYSYDEKNWVEGDMTDDPVYHYMIRSLLTHKPIKESDE